MMFFCLFHLSSLQHASNDSAMDTVESGSCPSGLTKGAKDAELKQPNHQFEVEADKHV